MGISFGCLDHLFGLAIIFSSNGHAEQSEASLSAEILRFAQNDITA